MAILLLLIVFLITLCVVAWHKTTYWKRRGIPSPPALPFLGHIHKIVDLYHPNVFVFREWSREYGKVYGIQKGWRNVLVVSDEKIVHEMMTTKFDYFHERLGAPLRGNVDREPMIHVFRARGKRWKRLRTLSNPVFSVQNLKKIMPTIEDTAHETMRFLEQVSATGRDFNIHPYMHEYTLDVISRIAMGQTESRQFKNKYTKILIESLQQVDNNFASASWIFPALSPLLLRAAKLYGKMTKYGFVELLRNICIAVKARKEQRARGERNEDAIDFIDLFLDAESDSVETEETGVYDKSKAQVTKRLTTEEVIAQCNIFLIAGFDTTANTLAITCHYLAAHPKIQERLREEINSVCVSANPTYEELQQLKFSDAVMKETLRLVPIASAVFSRTCAETTTLGDLTIEQGTHIQVDTFSLHLNKEIWGEDAEEFRPDRWFEPNVPTAYYPFGGGPRICIGMRLAYIEEKLLLVHILRRYRLVKGPRSASALKFAGQAVLNPDSVFVKLQELE